MGTVHCPSSWRTWWCTSSTCPPDSMLLSASDQCLIFKAALIYSMPHAFACYAAQKAVHSHHLHPLRNKPAETPLMALRHFSCPMVQSAFAHQPVNCSAAVQAEMAGSRCTGKKADRDEGCRGWSLPSAAAAAAKSALSFARSVSRADAWVGTGLQILGKGAGELSGHDALMPGPSLCRPEVSSSK